MKIFGFLLVGAALGVLFLFAWPFLKPAVLGPEPGGPEPAKAAAVAPIVVPERVQATGPTAEGKAPAEEDRGSLAERAKAAKEAEATAPAGPLCDKLFNESGARALNLPAGQKIRAGGGTGKAWTWVNLWAAWCKPCKAEMPELASFASKVREGGGRLRALFLSVDDDERQLRKYMAGEGAAIAGDFLWVQEESERAAFYNALGVANPPTLPVQVLVDPQGRLRCLRVGSITSKELDEAAKTFGFGG